MPPARPAALLAQDAAEASDRQARAEPSAPAGAPFSLPPFFAPAPAREEAAKDGQKAEPAPAEASPPQAAPGAGVSEADSAAADLPAACAALVEAGTITAEPELHLEVKDGCSLPSPVRLSGVRLKDGRLAPLKPAAILRCETVVAVAEWVREDLAPAVAELGSPMTALAVAASFGCRPRNNVKGARVSEHGFGNAIDVGGFETSEGPDLAVKNAGLSVAFQTRMKASACKRFSTVLGPGSDGYHEDHIHVDLAKRRNAYKLCRWVIKDKAPAVAAPLPQARPSQASSQAEGPTAKR